MSDDDAPKSAWELALERLKKKDREEGVEERALTEEQRAILESRGVLAPEEIHKLAGKGKKAACHSDHVHDEREARRIQEELLAKTDAKMQ